MKTLEQALKDRILVLDGAMGTMIQSYKLGEDDYRGERFADWASDLKGNNDLLTLTQPQIISDIHRAYLDAGADIVETNTFNANTVSMADYQMESLAYELNFESARLARAVCDERATEDKPRFVAGEPLMVWSKAAVIFCWWKLFSIPLMPRPRCLRLSIILPSMI